MWSLLERVVVVRATGANSKLRALTLPKSLAGKSEFLKIGSRVGSVFVLLNLAHTVGVSALGVVLLDNDRADSPLLGSALVIDDVYDSSSVLVAVTVDSSAHANFWRDNRSVCGHGLLLPFLVSFLLVLSIIPVKSSSNDVMHLDF